MRSLIKDAILRYGPIISRAPALDIATKNLDCAGG